NVALRGKGRDRVLVNHLLAAVALDDNRKIVECAHHAPDLKTGRQINGHWNAVLAELVEERILNVDGFAHGPLPPSRRLITSIFKLIPELSCYYSMDGVQVGDKISFVRHIHPFDVLHPPKPGQLPFRQPARVL